MMEAGALEEARTLRALHLSPDLPAMRAVGVPELIGHLEGKWSLDEAISRAQQMTRNYAKRQMTWFRHQLKE
jgi:tRNA dimethylallyltransferase